MDPCIDYVATAKSYGFRVTTLQDFSTAADRPSGLAERAAAYYGTHVMWDPDDDDEGFMLVGDDPQKLAKDWVDGHCADLKLTFL